MQCFSAAAAAAAAVETSNIRTARAFAGILRAICYHVKIDPVRMLGVSQLLQNIRVKWQDA